MTSTKLYIEIVKKIQDMIQEDGLGIGDKIPSERELSERLKVGRSSVREALRALELLGLIETRRGEGTFIKDFGDHQLVQLLGPFILQGIKKKSDLSETKYLIERDCITLACKRISSTQLNFLEEKALSNELSIDLLLKTLVESTDNLLLLRIWLVLNEYFNVSTAFDYKLNFLDFNEIIEGLKAGDTERVLIEYNTFAKKYMNSRSEDIVPSFDGRKKI